MKTFVATFLAILAAAAVILTALWAKQRIDQWERAKEMCYAQAETELKMMHHRVTRDQAEMKSMAQFAMDSHDVLGVAERAVASLDAMKESSANIVEIERKLVAILDAKPFGLPLTAQEKKDLEAAKNGIETADKQAAEERKVVTTKQDLSFPSEGGAAFVIPSGTTLHYLRLTGDGVIVKYNDYEVSLPYNEVDMQH